MNYNHPQEHTGDTCEADSFSFYWEKSGSLGEKKFVCVDSWIFLMKWLRLKRCFAQRYNQNNPLIAICECFEPTKVSFFHLHFKTRPSLQQLLCPSVLLPVSENYGRTWRHELPLVFNLFNYTHELFLCVFFGFGLFYLSKRPGDCLFLLLDFK